MENRTIRMFLQQDGASFGLLPVPVLQKPGAYQVELLDASGAVIAKSGIEVVDARFPRQNVSMSASTAELKATPEESEMLAAFRSTVSDVRYWSEPLIPPVSGCMTSLFGVQRYLNGKATGNFHGGLDQRGASGTPIRAVSGGVVKLARDWTLNGRTVAIDHGQGLLSVYVHMSKLGATEGALVKKGDVVGYVGSTGRSSAPHLHWSLYANGVPVNPLDWIKVVKCGAKARK
jgi:murein DD-endopeptidase MepM/ murein hydrolase activator NlpD